MSVEMNTFYLELTRNSAFVNMELYECMNFTL